MAFGFFLIYFMVTLIILYRRFNPVVWEVASGIYLFIATFVIGFPWVIGFFLWAVIIGCILILRQETVRSLIAKQLFQIAARAVPKLSKTEETALNAGDTWIEQDIFRGTLDWDDLAQINTELSDEEQSFWIMKRKHYVTWSMNGILNKCMICPNQSGRISRKKGF